MSEDKSETENPRVETDEFEETILNFLDQEIKDSSRTDGSHDAPSEDVDALVNSLLQEAITVSNEHPDTLEIAKEPIQRPAPVVTAVPSRVQERSSDRVKPVVEPRVERAAVVPPSPAPAPRAPVFAQPRQNRALSARMMILAGACICLLAGVGIVYYTGHGAGDAAKPNQPPPAVAQTAPTEPAAEPSAPIRQVAEPPAPTVHNPANSGASNRPSASSAAVEKNAGKSAAGRGENTANPQPQTKLESPAAAAAPSGAPDKNVKAAAAAEETPVKAPVRPAENAAPPQVVSVEPASAATSSQLDIAAPASLPNANATRKPSIPASTPTRSVTPAEVITKVLPTISEMARRMHATGTVTLDLAVDERGKVTKATPVSGPALLHQDAVNAVLQWKFRPAAIDGINVSSSSRVTVVFKKP